MRTLCDVYKSARHDLMYLYVRQQDGLGRVPDSLLEKFGTPAKTLTFVLTPDRKLAKEDTHTVISNIEAHGYHLQMPPMQKSLVGAPPVTDDDA